MLIDFFFELKKAKIPVTIRELLDLIRSLDKHIIFASIDDFYHLSKLILIKDEKYYDRFDKVFGYFFQGMEKIDFNLKDLNIPKEWLEKQLERFFTADEIQKIKKQGDLDKLLELFHQRLKEQKERHQGGNKWIGTQGTSPFGAFGYNPAGFRIEQGYSRHRKAIKVWEERFFKNLDDESEINERNLQVSLRKLRSFSKSHSNLEFDLDETILATAKNGGFLKIMDKFSRQNNVNTLIFFDVGGSMDNFVELTKKLFLAAKNEFKLMKYYYFHNCIYDKVWTDNKDKTSNLMTIQEIIRTFKSNYKIIIVGDATMSPYEILYPGGAIDFFNKETGAIWLKRIKENFDKCVWLNPQPQENWDFIESLNIIKQIFDNKMYPLTPSGIQTAMKYLN